MPTISKQCKTKCSCLTDILVSFKTLKLMPWISKHIHIIDHDKNIDMQKLYFNVQTMNMAFNAFTMWKNQNLEFATFTGFLHCRLAIKGFRRYFFLLFLSSANSQTASCSKPLCIGQSKLHLSRLSASIPLYKSTMLALNVLFIGVA